MADLGLRFTRQRSDWALVVRALQVAGWQDDMVERIRAACRESTTSIVTIDAYGREAESLDLAVSVADQGRPAHFPAVTREVI